MDPVLTQHVINLRGLSVDLARAMRRMQMAVSNHDGQAGAMLAELQASEVIPNESGLAGAGAITVGEVLAYTEALRAILTAYDTAQNHALWCRMAGPTNIA